MEKVSKPSRRWAIALGIGLALFPIHNLWLTEVTSINGQATLFLPWFGAAIWIIVSLSILRDHWKQIDWGGKKMVAPLLIIVASMSLSGFINGEGFGDRLAPMFMGVSMFALYGVARYLVLIGQDEDVKTPIIIMVLVQALSGIIMGIVFPGNADGGLITNYCAAVGFMILGGLLIPRKWLWRALIPILMAIFLLGALEGLFIIAILAIAMLVRRDWSKKLIIPVSILLVVVGLWTATGNMGETFNHAARNFGAIKSIVGRTEEQDENGGFWGTLNIALSGRLEYVVTCVTDIKVLGHGYDVTPLWVEATDLHPVHNTPLIILDQIGPLAALAWLWVTFFCLIKTKWKYIWVAILAASVFDYYVWTQFAPYWWLFIGLSTMETKSDLIFREV